MGATEDRWPPCIGPCAQSNETAGDHCGRCHKFAGLARPVGQRFLATRLVVFFAGAAAFVFFVAFLGAVAAFLAVVDIGFAYMVQWLMGRSA